MSPVGAYIPLLSGFFSLLQSVSPPGNKEWKFCIDASRLGNTSVKFSPFICDQRESNYYTVALWRDGDSRDCINQYLRQSGLVSELERLRKDGHKFYICGDLVCLASIVGCDRACCRRTNQFHPCPFCYENKVNIYNCQDQSVKGVHSGDILPHHDKRGCCFHGRRILLSWLLQNLFKELPHGKKFLITKFVSGSYHIQEYI